MASRLERVVQVMLLLQSGEQFNAIQLVERMGVHRRTIFRDIATLKSLGVPISYDPATSCYFIATSRTADLSSDQLTELLVAACLTMLPEGQSASVVRAAVEKLGRRLPKDSRRELLRIVRSFARRVPTDASPAEVQLLDLLLQSIRHGLALQMEVDEQGTSTYHTLQVAPLRLSFLDCDWRLYAYVYPGGPAREFGLSSIRHANLTEEKFSQRRLSRGSVVPPPKGSLVRQLGSENDSIGRDRKN